MSSANRDILTETGHFKCVATLGIRFLSSLRFVVLLFVILVVFADARTFPELIWKSLYSLLCVPDEVSAHLA
jgi:hypothetical protein